MGKVNCRSRERKRNKKRKAERARRSRKPVSLAYRGNKYKTDELAPVIFQTEVGIYQTFVMTDRKITDHTVRSALEKLILQVRLGSLPPLEDTTNVDYVEGGEQDLLIWSIRCNWQHFFQTEPHPGRDKLIGVLRTILGSIEVWGSISPVSRGYLHFVEEFVSDLGVSIEVASPEDFQRIAALD